jgi:hypothetical protein
MSDADDEEIVASGLAMHQVSCQVVLCFLCPIIAASSCHQATACCATQVSQWLGVSAEDVLHQTDAATEEMFEKPRPSL